MFTGIIENIAHISAIAEGPNFRRLTIASPWDDVAHGESIAVNGVCLTVAEISQTLLGFDVIAETLSKTNLGLLSTGDPVHLERSLRLADRISGHFVQGHVDGVAPLVDQQVLPGETRLTIEAPHHLAKYLIPKGSVALDGVSLTIATIEKNRFQVALIPTTLQLTALGRRPQNWPFNLECDMLSKTIISYLETIALPPVK